VGGCGGRHIFWRMLRSYRPIHELPMHYGDHSVGFDAVTWSNAKKASRKKSFLFLPNSLRPGAPLGGGPPLARPPKTTGFMTLFVHFEFRFRTSWTTVSACTGIDATHESLTPHAPSSTTSCTRDNVNRSSAGSTQAAEWPTTQWASVAIPHTNSTGLCQQRSRLEAPAISGCRCSSRPPSIPNGHLDDKIDDFCNQTFARPIINHHCLSSMCHRHPSSLSSPRPRVPQSPTRPMQATAAAPLRASDPLAAGCCCLR